MPPMLACGLAVAVVVDSDSPDCCRVTILACGLAVAVVVDKDSPDCCRVTV